MSTIAHGVHDYTFAEYHAIEAWGSSALKAMRRGPPARVLWERDNDRGDTDATILGTAVHCALLTPTLYAASYDAKPEGMSFASKEGKAWRDDPVRAGKTILSHDVAATVQAIVDALLAKKAVHAALTSANTRESSMVWECSVTHERCKSRPDWTDDRYIYDLKVSRYAGAHNLALRTYIDGWQHQLAHYRTGAIELGLPIRGGRLVVVDPVAPHFIHCLEVKMDALDLLEIENIETVKALRECRVSGVWPGTSESWIKVEPPASAGMDSMNDVVLHDETEEAELAEEVA